MDVEIERLLFRFQLDQVEILRSDRRDLPGVVARWGDANSLDWDLYLRLSPGEGPAIERRVASIPGERLRRWFGDVHEDLGRRFLGSLIEVTPEDLAELGYGVIAPTAEQHAEWLQRFAPARDDGRHVVTATALEGPESEAIVFDAEIPVIQLHELGVPGQKLDQMVAFSRDGTRPALLLYWRESNHGFAWAALPVDSWQEQMREVLQTHMPAGANRPISSIIRHLKLEEIGFDVKRLEGNILPGQSAPDRPFEGILARHAERAFDIEHFASVGAFAASTAEGALLGPGGAGFAELDAFGREIARHAICRLLESTEIAIGELRTALISALWDARWRKAHDDVSRARGESGEERIREMLKATKGQLAEVDTFAHLNKLRHGWTHRSAKADARLFTDLGRQGKDFGPLTWCGVTLDLRRDEEVVVDQRHVRATCRLVTRLLDALVVELESKLSAWAVAAELPDAAT
jgi:hypothetical protein